MPKQKFGKPTYVFRAGVKERRGKNWVHLRVRNSPHETTKMCFGRSESYKKVLEKMKAEFDLSYYEPNELVLVDNENDVVEETNFSSFNYVHKDKKKITGPNRIFIGIDKKSPSPLTLHHRNRAT